MPQTALDAAGTSAQQWEKSFCKQFCEYVSLGHFSLTPWVNDVIDNNSSLHHECLKLCEALLGKSGGLELLSHEGTDVLCLISHFCPIGVSGLSRQACLDALVMIYNY